MSNSLIPAQYVDCMETHCAEETAYLCAVDSPIPSSFFVHVSVLHFPNLSFNSLLDCSSSHCFLDEHFACSNYFPVTSISLMRLWLLDGSLARTITHASQISIKFPCGILLQIWFLLTKLDCDFPAVLGLDWLTLLDICKLAHFFFSISFIVLLLII